MGGLQDISVRLSPLKTIWVLEIIGLGWGLRVWGQGLTKTDCHLIHMNEILIYGETVKQTKGVSF